MLHAMVRICRILDIDIGDHLNVGRTSCTVKKSRNVVRDMDILL